MPAKSLLSLLLLGFFCACSPDLFEPMQLSEASRKDAACSDELTVAMERILAAELTGVDPAEGALSALVETGRAEQSIRLYGADQIWRWTLASFAEDQCSLYNVAQTRIDVMTQEKRTRTRPVRGTSGAQAKVDLRHCSCVEIDEI